MTERPWSVYILTSPGNKAYVGMTSRPLRRRWAGGCGYLRKKAGRYAQARMAEAVLKYRDWDLWEHNVFCENLSKEEAAKLEHYLVLLFKTNDPKYGYNNDNGGIKNRVTEERKKRLSVQMRGEGNPNYGNHKIAGVNHPRAKRILQISKEGDVVQEWEYASLAAQALGLDLSNIIACCYKRKGYKTAGGFIWVFADQMEVQHD